MLHHLKQKWAEKTIYLIFLINTKIIKRSIMNTPIHTSKNNKDRFQDYNETNTNIIT